VPFWTIPFTAMVISTAAVGVAAHNADRIASGSLARALIVNGANLLTYALIWTARYSCSTGSCSEPGPSIKNKSSPVELAGETSVSATADSGVLESGLPNLSASETVDPVAEAR